MRKILISRCFLGENVRYDGGNQLLLNHHIELWKNQQRLIAICPEVSGGLSVPRSPAEFNQSNGKIYTVDGEDVSAAFHRGAQQALALCKKYGIRFALLKESSPSCGSKLIYDGTFTNRKISGQGVTASLLLENGIKVFSENSIEQLADLLKTE